MLVKAMQRLTFENVVCLFCHYYRLRTIELRNMALELVIIWEITLVAWPLVSPLITLGVGLSFANVKFILQITSPGDPIRHKLFQRKTLEAPKRYFCCALRGK